ncbi:MAG: DUF4272 domain-containing protein [Planctomycetes bacterium]|nr:DUF4272 domain-containing protein [Planctomycetota bacterium]
MALVLPGILGCSNRSPSAAPKKIPKPDTPSPTQQVSIETDEALERKRRSIAILKASRIPVMDGLPVIEAESASVRRSANEVAVRAMALCVVACKGEGLEQEVVQSLIKKFQLETAFTPEEVAFLENPSPTQHERTQFVWRYECYWVLLWALGHIETLERPDSICDVKLAVSILRDLGREGFIQKAKYRSQREILDEADLIYRYHWAIVDARINRRKPPAGLDGDVIQERHHAFNWLIGYLDQEWDEVSTDT